MPRARDPVLLSAIGARIRRLRRERGLTQEQLGDLTGLQAAAVSRIESGALGFTITSGAEIARALGVPLSELFGDEAERDPSGLDDAERRLLSRWRHMSTTDQEAVMRVLDMASRREV